MSVAKVIEVTSTSDESFEDAIERGIARAGSTLKNVEGAWIKEQKIMVEDGRINGYQVNMLLTFILDEAGRDYEMRDEPRTRMGMRGGGRGARR